MSELTNGYDYENIKKKLATGSTEDNSNSDNDNVFNNEDFVLMRKKNEDGTEEIIGGGYKIESFFMENGKPILTTFNDKDGKEKQHGGKVSSPFESLAVPAGLFYINQRVPTNKKGKEKEHYYENHEVISDDIMDKLFGLIKYNNKQQSKTRKQRIKNVGKQKSRKQR